MEQLVALTLLRKLRRAGCKSNTQENKKGPGIELVMVAMHIVAFVFCIWRLGYVCTPYVPGPLSSLRVFEYAGESISAQASGDDIKG